MKKLLAAIVPVLTTIVLASPQAQAAPCLIVTLTGTQSGPPADPGLAGAGTLVRYGDDANSCGAVKLQFDSGRGTTMRLSQVGVSPDQLNAIFFTHMHSDHVDGFADIVQLRWHQYPDRPKIDVVCSADAESVLGFTVSCKNFIDHIGIAYLQSGEIAQRHSENTKRPLGGPVELINAITFQPTDEPRVIWTSDDVKVSTIRSTHIPGHASYRVDTPAGSVVIGGDASNDVPAPPRPTSTSDQVERLAKGVDIIVHSTAHPVRAGSAFPQANYRRQSSTTDLGAMAKRAGAKYLVLTHLAPPLGAELFDGVKLPDGPITEASYRQAAEAGGFAGQIVVGTDLASVKLPAK
jgi:ribonuclease Z